MNLFPISITRTIKVVRVRKNKSLRKISFHAKFADGAKKTISRKDWVLSDLLKPFEIENEIEMQKDCPLYRQNWSRK